MQNRVRKDVMNNSSGDFYKQYFAVDNQALVTRMRCRERVSQITRQVLLRYTGRSVPLLSISELHFEQTTTSSVCGSTAIAIKSSVDLHNSQEELQRSNNV